MPDTATGSPTSLSSPDPICAGVECRAERSTGARVAQAADRRRRQEVLGKSGSLHYSTLNRNDASVLRVAQSAPSTSSHLDEEVVEEGVAFNRSALEKILEAQLESRRRKKQSLSIRSISYPPTRLRPPKRGTSMSRVHQR